MFENYLKVAIRSVAKEKIFSVINIFGLALGMACCMLIYLFVQDEFSFDSFHKNAHSIFRVLDVSYNPDGSERSSNSNHPVPLGPALKADLPEVERFVRFRTVEHFVRSTGEAIEEPVLYADSTVFTVFSFPLVKGNPKTALSDLKAVVISEKAAHKYFGRTNPIGQSLGIRIKDRFEEFVVTAIARNVPGNSSIQFDILLPFENLYTYFAEYPTFRSSWGWISIQTYVELREHTSIEGLQAKLPALFKKYYPEEQDSGEKYVSSYRLQPIIDMHFSSASNPLYSYILSGIAFVVLLIACVNFMTLSVGRAAGRAPEVGLRKVVGARRHQLIGQYWGEAVTLSFLGLILGILLAEFLLPTFNDLAGKQLQLNYLDNSWTAAAAILIALFTGVVAGSYPAFMLSSFKPVQLLRNKLKLGGANRFTRSLVVMQFTMTVVLTTSTLVMTSQLDYTRSKHLGYNKDEILILEMNGVDGIMVADRLRTKLAGNPGIADITATSNTLGKSGASGRRYPHEGKMHTISVFAVEPNYLDFVGLQLLHGRNFNPNLASDLRQSTIVNEALVRDFDLADPIGKAVPGIASGTDNEPIIIGIVKDYNFQSLYREIIPMMLTLDRDWGYDYLLVRLRPGRIAESITTLKNAWQEIVQEVPFVYHFMDDEMQAQYLSDQRWEQIVQYASLFAILIACLGLLGLTSISVARRTKEVGIRKVLGASATNIIALISKEFFWLVLAGNVLAAPIAYLTMQRWLQSFAYRTEIGLSPFLVAAGLALGIALITIGLQVTRAALANPVEALRYE